jgi:hypothetical protein
LRARPTGGSGVGVVTASDDERSGDHGDGDEGDDPGKNAR